jgi:uncharacterized protein YndB with AHSA1/START domain
MPLHGEAAPRNDLVIDRETFTIRLTRSFDAAPADIFRAWSEPDHVALWWDPAGKPLAECLIDLKVGGGFRFVSEGHPEMPFTGVYLEIEPPTRLVFDANGARGVVALTAQGGKTHMLVEIICKSAEHLDQYIQLGVHVGTTQTLDNLVAYAAERFDKAA